MLAIGLPDNYLVTPTIQWSGLSMLDTQEITEVGHGLGQAIFRLHRRSTR